MKIQIKTSRRNFDIFWKLEEFFEMEATLVGWAGVQKP